MRNKIGWVVGILGPALGSIFFVFRPWLGVLLWLGLAQNPRYAAFALVGLGVGEAVRRSLTIPASNGPGGDLRANALLTAVMAAWLTAPAALSLPLQLGIVIASAAGSALLSAATARVLGATQFPPLVLAYCLMASALFSIFPDWTVLAANAMPPSPAPAHPGAWPAAFIRSLGSLIYQPTVITGLIVGSAILLWSRTLFLCGTIGWLAGAGTALLFQQLGVQYLWPPAAYNYFLAGMALGASFFLPGRASLLVAAAAGCAASFIALALQHLLEGAAAAYLPITAVLTIWTGLGALLLAGERGPLWRNHTPQVPPEEAWWRAAHWAQRFGHQQPLLAVPVAGAVRVAQGFGGRLSHVGLWRHALDFQTPVAGTAAASPATLWDSPVTSPAAGVVERVRNDVPDNPLGVSNYAENWGNHVVIRLDQGGWALLAHLRQGTISVVTGNRVETGSYLGRVGNSGRSPTPHLHLQAQSGAEPGDPTMPFRLANFLSATGPDGRLSRWNASGLPTEGETVSAAPANPPVHNILASIAPGSAVWMVESNGRVPRRFRHPDRSTTFRTSISLDAAGRHVFRTDAAGELVACLAPDAWRTLELHEARNPFLTLLGLAAPSLPYAATKGTDWHDLPPLIPAGPLGWAKLVAAPHLKQPFQIMHCACTAEPDALNLAIRLATTPTRPRASLPRELTCRFELLRGPVALHAVFAHGEVNYSLLSFEPGLPFAEQQN